MLRSMRENIKSLSVTLWLVIAAFIGTTFLVWGRGSVGSRDSAAVASVNGDEISIQSLENAYRNIYEIYKQIYRDRFTEEMATQLNLRQQALNGLIQEKLIIQRAKKDGIRVSDEEIKEFIKGYPAFQQDGAFSKDRYLKLLSYNRITPASFEDEQRKILAQKKMESIIKEGVKVSEDEVKDLFNFRNEKIRARYLLVETVPLGADFVVKDEDLKSFYEKRKQEYKKPEQRAVSYVVISPKRYFNEIKISDAEVEKFYNENPDKFRQPKKVKVSHILVRLEPDAKPEAEKKVKDKIEAVQRKLKEGGDFAKVARENSEDPGSASKGGDIGYIVRGETIPNFEQIAFSTKKGETSDIIRTQFGYHILRVTDVKEESKIPIGEVKEQIRPRLLAERAENLARNKAEEVHKLLFQAKDFIKEAEKNDLPVRDTGLFTRGKPIKDIGLFKEFEDAAFSLSAGGTSPVLKGPEGYYILRLSTKKDSYVPDLIEVKQEVINAFKLEKAENITLEKARGLLKDIQKGEDITSLSHRERVKSGDTGLFSRVEPIRDFELAQDISKTAFELSLGSVSEPVKAKKGYYIIKVVEKVKPDESKFLKEKDELERYLFERKRNQLWQEWISDLRRSAKVEVKPGLLD